MTDQEEKVEALRKYLKGLLSSGEIKADHGLYVIYADGIAQMVRGDLISLVSADAIESTLEIYYTGYKPCPNGCGEMEQFITKEETFGIIWNWICPKCKYMDPSGWFDEKPKK